MSSPIELFDKPRLAVDLPIAFGDVQLNPAQVLEEQRALVHVQGPKGIASGSTFLPGLIHGGYHS